MLSKELPSENFDFKIFMLSPYFIQKDHEQGGQDGTYGFQRSMAGAQTNQENDFTNIDDFTMAHNDFKSVSQYNKDRRLFMGNSALSNNNISKNYVGAPFGGYQMQIVQT